MSETSSRDGDLVRAVLDARGLLSFQVSGYCMFPCLHPGDHVVVTPRRLDAVRIGEIAVFRRDGRLFAHRVVHVAPDAPHPHLVTRPDASPCDDPPCDAQALLGIVARVHRRGRILGTAHCARTRRTRLLLWWHQTRTASVRALGGLVRRMQDVPGYRPVATLLAARWPTTCVVRVPFSARLPGFFRSYPVDSCPPSVLDASPEWSVVIVRGGAEVASLTLTRAGHPQGRWQIQALQVRVRYRHMGFDERLLATVETLLAATPHASLCVPRSAAWVETSLVKRLGFWPDPESAELVRRCMPGDVDHD